jgi:hypothetical protein
LYHIINFGHQQQEKQVENNVAKNEAKSDPRIISELDLPTDLFRAQLVCEILNTCGVYYVRGQAREKLNKFLVYFQRYLLTKQFIPLHVEFAILDMFDYLEELAKNVLIENNKKKMLAKKENKHYEEELVIPKGFL